MTPGPGLQRTLLPKGFFASGVNCGVRRYRPDMGLIFSDVPATAAGVFTTNACAAAPVHYSKALLPGKGIRAILTNSGQANAATGEQGVKDNLAMVEACAAALQVQPNEVLVASTGVIGKPLEMDKIIPGMPELAARLTDVTENFALAILTTDLVPKSMTTMVALSTGVVRLTGIAKGSGMIHPNMATMLGYLLTDAQIEPGMCHLMLKEVVDESFNMISVDGDTSTNDCVFMMANGASGISLAQQKDIQTFRKALLEVAQFLAQSIAADGEGATKLVEVEVRGLPDVELARVAARAVTTSPLVKTAIHGEDPNWGRILAKLGTAGIPANAFREMNLSIQGKEIFKNGAPLAFDRDEVRKELRLSKVRIEVDFGTGGHRATAWGCDLSKKYVDINTEYS
ncbi:MAG: bifunctional glutamate N-acetyltransferase/amino-acid acetyltransferase ArgJ [Bdellovibrionaceae bacterium]|nr:bifunctional glutamate N-acetyltransferase/amino-acid acetyltransferase ArgJ [Pseudobdellovibrionaceae bacterium]